MQVSTEDVAAEGQTGFKTAISRKSKLKDILGQFATKQFYVDMAKVVAHELFTALLKSVALAVHAYVTKREDPAMKDYRAAPPSQPASPAAAAFSAPTFSQGYTPASSYGSYNRSVPMTVPDQTFPGFKDQVR